MRKGTWIMAAAAAGLLVSSLNASALVLVAKSEEQKLRADIQKQTHGYSSCLVKAATSCEKSGAVVGAECTLATGVAVAPADAKGKFVADIAKCDGKLAFMKKAKTLSPAAAYTAMGCPGDSDSVTAGDQPYTDVTTWQTGTPASTKKQIDTLAIGLGALSGCADPDPKVAAKCQASLNKVVASYAAAVQKCQLACENDFSDKKGNGGGFDSTTACSLTTNGDNSTGDVNFDACVDKAFAKATKTELPMAVTTVVFPALASALNDANNDLNNENDCP